MATSSWPKVPIGSICDGIFDGPHATPHKTDGGPIFLGISNLRNGRLDLRELDHLSESDFGVWTRRVVPCAGDVVFSYETRLGEAAMIPGDLRCCLGRRMALMRPNKSTIEPRFLLYAYLGPEFQEVLRARTVHGSTVDRIPLIEFPSFPISLPPRSEQRAIADILGAFDDKIELNRRMNETLEATCRALFESWFVDFDPVRSQAEGRPLVNMDADTAALFPDGFEESEVGAIPRGWHVGTLADIACNPRVGVRPEDIAPTTPYIGLEHMPRHSITLGEWGTAADIASNKFAFRTGEILFGKLRPYFHKVGVAPVDGVCSTDILVIRPDDRDWFGYLLLHLSSDDFIAFVSGRADGTRMPRANWGDIASYMIALPDKRVAAAFTRQVEPMVNTMRANIMNTRALAEVRDTLLPKLLLGELRVPEVEHVAKKALA